MENWKNKLLAFLHDPPSKAFNIPEHQELAWKLMHQAEFTADEAEKFSKEPDWAASAADRIPMPASQAGGLRCTFDGIHNRFHHPLGSGDGTKALTLPFQSPFATSDLAFETDASIQPVLAGFGNLPDDLADERGQRWRARFFAHWRLWQKHAAERDYRFAYLPADTRIPDHTIWTHIQMVSALAGCEDSTGSTRRLMPAFLKFQLGPVQDFIAAARSIRDLWSGSYLLSWLMATGLKALSAEIGPDAVIYPNLRGQPLFDLHWRRELWSQARIGGMSVWESLGWENRQLLTPTLPNVFLALAPAASAADLGRLVTKAIQDEWRRIAQAAWSECERIGLTADEPGLRAEARKGRFDAQVSRFLALTWQANPWPETLEGALALADGFDEGMPIQQARKTVLSVVEMATRKMPEAHRDARYYTDDSKTRLNNLGLGWSVILAFNSWALDAVRQTRPFEAVNSGGWQSSVFNNKDSLNGREEAVAGGKEWSARAKAADEPWGNLFKKDDWLGASTLVKRVWHQAYLKKEPWNLKAGKGDFPMPNTRGVARHAPEEDCSDDDSAADAPASEKYFAVLALDGDEIGKWVSGEKTPPLAIQLADYRDDAGARLGALAYFKNESDPDGQGALRTRFTGFLAGRRPLSPGYHLQFSEALGNFALHCAHPIVEVFDGRLIYAGGDDVLALLPADTALACAEALRLAFQGRPELKEFLRTNAIRLRDHHEAEQRRDRQTSPSGYYQKLAAEGCLLESAAPGFLSRLDHADQQGRPIPLLVPGPAAECSVGVAIAHFKAPLQDVVRAAQAAEQRAKKKLHRGSVAVTLFKRSGETIEWGCQWGSGGLDLYRSLSKALQDGELNAKFPHRAVELLSPYLTERAGLGERKPPAGQTAGQVQKFEAVIDDIVQRELIVVCERQRGAGYQHGTGETILVQARSYLEKLAEVQARNTAGIPEGLAAVKLRAMIGLCQTVAFANRTAREEQP